MTGYALYEGDCLDILPTLEAGSVDSIVTDPPYGLSFMGKNWDHGVPGVAFWVEALRVAKPGAHLLAFGGTRTFHRLAVAIEDAGWEIRDCVMWVYGSGFPKSLDVSKAIDKAAGAEREVVGKRHDAAKMTGKAKIDGTDSVHEGWRRPWMDDPAKWEERQSITAPATPEAQQWDGWGTALKPAWEPVIVARKPLSGTVAQNVLRYGTGAINVDGCRVEADPAIDDMLCTTTRGKRQSETWENGSRFKNEANSLTGVPANGRWPANVIHDGSDEVVGLFPVTTSGSKLPHHRRTTAKGKTSFASGVGGGTLFAPPEGENFPGSTGSAARFFYCAKASKADRDEGCDGLPFGDPPGGGRSAPAEGQQSALGQPRRNHHPTVKPTSLMRYLCRLVTPPGGVVLDPFCGSGSTGKAAILEGFGFVGIEQAAEYIAIAEARIGKAHRAGDVNGLPMFGGEGVTA